MLADCLKFYCFIRVFADNGNQSRGGRGKQGELPALARRGHGRERKALEFVVFLF